jgi:hypothetical protein
MIPLFTILEALNSEQAADVFGILVCAGASEFIKDNFVREMMRTYHFTHTEATRVCADGVTRTLTRKMTSR